jgi:dTDP-glucose pyrophosphorylase
MPGKQPAPKHWESALLDPDMSLEQAIAIVDRSALRIGLVADRERRLLGTLTDGDVRRALLKHLSLDTAVSTVMCATPRVAKPDWSRAQVLAAMEGGNVLHLPVVDGTGRLVGLETLHGLLQKTRKDNPVFLMAGGFGTRLHPMTQNIPKPLLKVGNKPLLELILEGFIAAGFHRFFISVHYMPEMIKNHFGDGSQWGVDIRYIHEDTPLGTGGALGMLPHAEIDLPLIVMNGDLLTTVDYAGLLDFHEANGGIATMCVCQYEHRVPFGVIVSEDHVIRSIDEKPLQTWFINAGIYVLSPELVKRVPSGQRADMPVLLAQEIASGRSVTAFPLREYWLDVGRMDEFEKAQADVRMLFGD